MKYVVVIGDGMPDYELPELSNKTPLEAAFTPTLDFLASNGKMGLSHNIPEGMPTGSDTAILSVFGYDPYVYYTGRAPLEAISIGIDFGVNDASYRSNFVTLEGGQDIAETVMKDYCAGEIGNSESSRLIDFLNENIKYEGVKFFAGRSYRNSLVRYNASIGANLTQPHDISTQPVKNYLPKGNNAELILSIMRDAYKILPNHPININRVKNGLNPANAVWLWGEGRKPDLPSFSQKYNIKKGAVISAVDLIEGIGISAGFDIIKVPGVTGNYNTNYKGKAEGVINALNSGYDFVCVHIEAPDECGHRAEIKEKVYSIERIDEDILKPVLDYLENRGEEFSLLVTPDHPTPIPLLTHTREGVPFVIYKKGDKNGNNLRFTEKCGQKAALRFDKGCELMDLFIGK